MPFKAKGFGDYASPCISPPL